MTEELFRNRYRILSARAPWHGYNGGMYFITICTKNKEHYLGKITNDEMHLSKIGNYAQACIQQIPQHHPYAEIPLWVVMPNHIHALVIIDGKKIPHNKRTIEPLNGNFSTGTSNNVKNASTIGSTTVVQPIQIATQMQSWLSVVVHLFKQSVTRFAKQNGIRFAWQPRFHDHIIRHTDEMNRIAEYIEQNVKKWASDEYHKRAHH